jgi:spore germination protein YaaH
MQITRADFVKLLCVGAFAGPGCVSRGSPVSAAAPGAATEASAGASPSAARRLTASAWLPTEWDTENAMRSFRDHANALAEVSPVWFKLGLSGETAGRSGKGQDPGPTEAEVKDICSARGVRLIPLISNAESGSFDKERVSRVINDASKRARHIDDLVTLATRRGYDGIELDYELLYNEDRDTFSEFVDELARSLHGEHKRLAIAVHPKLSEPGENWGGYGPIAHDWKALGLAVDSFRVMIYDFHWGGRSNPGPIAPLGWYQRVIEFARSLVPPEKIQAGIPTYGYDWDLTGGTAENIAPRHVPELRQKYGFSLEWDDEANAPHFRYQRDGREHEVWYEDARCLAPKLQIAIRAGIDGTAIWRLGTEEPAFWEALEKARG